MHAKGACFHQHSGIGDFVLPRDTHDSLQAMQMESFQEVLLSGVRCPGLTAVQQGAKEACLIYLEFSVSDQLVVIQDLLAQF